MINVPVYLDHCPEGAEIWAEARRNPDIYRGQIKTREQAEAIACDGCPIGGSVTGECPGVWRRSSDDSIFRRGENPEEEPV